MSKELDKLISEIDRYSAAQAQAMLNALMVQVGG
jgi:hypothetical protein